MILQTNTISANSFTCKTCEHYKQHYILTEYCCTAIPCGHCARVRFKHTKPTHSACAHYTVRTGAHSLPNRIETIHFLTTTILERILELQLPPEVHDPFGDNESLEADRL